MPTKLWITTNLYTQSTNTSWIRTSKQKHNLTNVSHHWGGGGRGDWWGLASLCKYTCKQLSLVLTIKNKKTAKQEIQTELSTTTSHNVLCERYVTDFDTFGGILRFYIPNVTLLNIMNMRLRFTSDAWRRGRERKSTSQKPLYSLDILLWN